MDEKSYHHPDLRKKLLQAAVKLLKEDGIRDFSMRKLAARAGVSHGAPYRHFSGKDELLACIMMEGHRRLREDMLAARRGCAGGSLGKLRALGKAYLEFARRNPEHLKVMFTREGLVSAEKLSHAPEGVGSSEYDSFGVLVETVADAQAEKCLDGAVDPGVLSLSIWTEIHGLAILCNEGLIKSMVESRGGSEGEVVAQLLDLIGKGSRTA